MATNFPAFQNSEMSRPLAVNNNASNPYEMELVQFSGEILASYMRSLVLSPRVSHRNITKGRSYQFPLVGRAKAHYHTTGSHVNMDGIKTAQRLITVPGVVTSATMIDDFETMITHFEDRQQKAKEIGEALAYLKEIHTAMVLAQVAHMTKAIDDADQVDGKFITNDKFKLASDGASTKAEFAAAVCEAIFQANVVMDDASVPDLQRTLALRSNEYNMLFEGIKDVVGYAINREYGGYGSFAEGTLPKIGGVELLKANTIPKTNIPQDTDNYKHYYGNFSKLIGMIFLPEAMGCVDLMSVSVENIRKPEYLGELILAKHAYGLGGLRPECCVTLELSTLTNA